MEYLVIDVGGTAIKYACMNENAEFLERGEIPTPLDSLDSYLAALGTNIYRYDPVAYTHLGAQETGPGVVCRFLLEKKKNDFVAYGDHVDFIHI